MANPLEKLSLYISAAAAIIVLIACIISGATLYWMAAWVSLSIVAFYLIGEGVRYFLVTSVFPPEEEEEDYGEEYAEPEAYIESDIDTEDEMPEDDGADEELEEEAESEPVEDAFLDS